MKRLFSALVAFCTAVLETAIATPVALEGMPLGKMAKVKFSALVSEMRNKLNGSVFSKNRAGNYLRNKVTPVNPQTSYQTAVRAILTAASQAWRALTQAQRDAWAGAVENFKKTDIFGDIKTPSGINLFNQFYLNASTIGGTPLNTPPAPDSSPGVPDATFAPDSSPQTFSLTSGLTSVPTGQDWVVRATAGVSAGKNYLKNAQRIIAVIPAGTSLPYAGITDYQTKFGNLVQGERVGWEVYAIDTTTFIKGPKTTGSAIVL